ncbi:MAG: ABC transporter permease [Anaerolineales bacterium]|nr:ABC transporter permease [Anaerolineales bacterium]
MTDSVDSPQPNPEKAPPKDQQSSSFARITGVGTGLGRALLLPTLALLSALIIGAFLIAFTDLEALTLLNKDLLGALRLMADGVWAAYKALFGGAFGSIYGVSETLFAATPLILTGLAVALGFRAGLFNIGVTGQMLIGGMAAIWVGLNITLPGFLHIPLALVAAVLAGAVWAGISGFLKARTGAHEVITTIMLNFIALFLVEFLLKTPAFQDPSRNNPISEQLPPSAQFPEIFGSDYRVTIGLLIAGLAVIFVNWLLFRSSWGFEFRAVGFNPIASRYAGMKVAGLYVLVMAISGGLAGVAGANQVMGLSPYQVTTAFAGTIGFDAIALALLGRSHPVGVLWAALLFGALKAGGRSMQAAAQIPLELVSVIVALIIVFIAAPELVRAIFRVKPLDKGPTQLTKGWG